jgi:CRISPR-associated protein Cmr2
VSELFWQAKIWGLLHDSPLKPLIADKGWVGPWECLDVMSRWQASKNNDLLIQADHIAAATDRAAFGALGKWSEVDYSDELRHLLSSENLPFQLAEDSPLRQGRNRIQEEHTRIGKADWQNYTDEEKKSIKDLVKAERETAEKITCNVIPQDIKNSRDAQEVFWWMWRCLPEALSRHPDINNPSLLLIPAETRIPDCSIWSHNSMVAALAGSLMGYDGSNDSRPCVATFTFTPVQEVVKASRKMQDFWAGSWILHYLSACICWAWAEKYGPDSVVYPSLYDQPLVDDWLIQKYPHFKRTADENRYEPTQQLKQPKSSRLLTAGFSNVLVLVLPQSEVKSAMDLARRMLTGESPEVESPWMKLAEQVKQEIFGNIQIAPSVWEEWLKAQWQIYWTALPLGDLSEPLAKPTEANFQVWRRKQNDLAGLSEKKSLFQDAEAYFFQEAQRARTKKGDFHLVNIGSWWAPIFDQIRNNLNAVKNARTWSIPTAFGSRSTISGIGAVVRREAKNDWVYFDEADDSSPVNRFWEKQRGLFDGREQLNATEVVKRGLKKVLPQILSLPSGSIPTYPDLTVGVAGWLKRNPQELEKYQKICDDLLNEFDWADEAAAEPWGIPWVDEDEEYKNWKHPRLLNAGWLIDDYLPRLSDATSLLTPKKKQEQTREEFLKLRSFLDKYFSSGNPTDWYVLACGDGDDMGKWLKGTKMEPYRRYVPSGFPKQEPTKDEKKALEKFLDQTKRMGPATHAALSRALLDFSNQLVPYLTEQRYAGRLIYSGGDDVLAYTNLWEWDSWLWDVRECFKGSQDPHDEFDDTGDYWRWKAEESPENVSARPLFTMGGNASISFGIVIAHHSVPLAIALENLWAAEEEAKEHIYIDLEESDPKKQRKKKDAVQVRVLYGNGNILQSTSKFDVFNQWKTLLNFKQTHPRVDFDPALFEQAAEIWRQHPVPFLENSPDPFAAIAPWAAAFCDRRELFKGEGKEQAKQDFQAALAEYLKAMCLTTQEDERDRQIQNWLKLAAFVLRKRDIKIGGVA